jgi:nuclear receptor interaction protein
MIAVAGIDSTVKIFSPDARARQDAALARNGVSAADTSTFASIGVDLNYELESSVEDDDDEPLNGPSSRKDDSESDSEEFKREKLSENGLMSRKMMKKEYRITSRNDMTRRSELQQNNIRSQGVYQMLAAQLAAQFGARGVDGLADEDNCALM